MPLAPLEPSNTMRLWVLYNDGVFDHKFQLRGREGQDAAALMGTANDILASMGTSLYEITIQGAEFAPAGTNIRNAVDWTWPTTFGVSPMPTINAPREVAWEGRSADGRLISLSLYGYSGATPADYRFDADEVATLTMVRNALVAASNAGIIGTISGAKPIWKTYQNFNFNSYYERKLRG